MLRFRDLMRGLMRPPTGRTFDPSTFEFPPIDLDRAAEQLSLREKAASNGRSELPAEGSLQLDGPQQAIIQFVKGEVADITTAFETKISGLNRQITRRDIRQLVDEVTHLDGSLEHDLLATRDELRPRIVEARDELSASERRYSSFREANALDREPDYPDSHFLHGTIVALVLVGEAVLNGVFFERGNPHGLVGGAVYALMLALIDVSIVFSLGRVAAWSGCSSSLHALAGRAAMLAFVAWAGAYNLLVAHVREALRTDPERAMQIAGATFRDAPLTFAHADTWILLAIGIFFSVVAMLDGFSWTDRFPGYARLHRQLVLRRDEVRYFEAEIVRRAAEVRDQALARLGLTLVEARKNLVSMQNDIEAKSLLLKNGRVFVGHQEDTCNALIAVYRDENQKARSTPPPRYFHEKLALGVPPVFTDDTEADVERLADCRQALEGLESRADVIRSSAERRHAEFRRDAAALFEDAA
jgi:hypothetical protein